MSAPIIKFFSELPGRPRDTVHVSGFATEMDRNGFVYPLFSVTKRPAILIRFRCKFTAAGVMAPGEIYTCTMGAKGSAVISGSPYFNWKDGIK